jgi:hypothetical protein
MSSMLRSVIYGIICLTCAETTLGETGLFDGFYTGQRVLTKGDPGACLALDAVTVTVRGGVLTFTTSRVKEYTISLSQDPDGSFDQLSADIGGEVVDIRGRIAAGVLDGDVTSATCTHHWHLEKRATGQNSNRDTSRN